MGRFCKAYRVERLRAFDGWSENPGSTRSEPAADGDGEAAEPRELSGDDYLYVQDDYTVTDGIFVDEHVVFDDVTPEWKAFCHDELDFDVPEFESPPTGGDGDADVAEGA